MHLFDHVSFDPDCAEFPAGMAADGWKTALEGSAGTLYHFDASGRLLRRSSDSSLTFVSHDACGSFILYSRELDGACLREHRATFFNGLLVAVEPLRSASDHAGFIGHPTWQLLDAAEIGVSGAIDLHDIEANIDLIRAAHRDPLLKADSPTSELMLAIALCQPARLGGTNPRDALRSLNSAQRQAVISWEK